MTMRLPIRRRPATRAPRTALSGGATVLSRKGLRSRMRSSGWPTIRGSRDSMYTATSGSSGIAGGASLGAHAGEVLGLHRRLAAPLGEHPGDLVADPFEQRGAAFARMSRDRLPDVHP